MGHDGYTRSGPSPQDAEYTMNASMNLQDQELGEPLNITNLINSSRLESGMDIGPSNAYDNLDQIKRAVHLRQQNQKSQGHGAG